MLKKAFVLIIFSLLLFQFIACNKQPYKTKYSNVKGYVIGKETCNNDETQDYWLIDLTYLPNTPQHGDTLSLNGQDYLNVVKTKALPNQAEEIGKKISINFNSISPNEIETTGCSIANPVTFNLKEIFIHDVGEIR